MLKGISNFETEKIFKEIIQILTKMLLVFFPQTK